MGSPAKGAPCWSLPLATPGHCQDLVLFSVEPCLSADRGSLLSQGVHLALGLARWCEANGAGSSMPRLSFSLKQSEELSKPVHSLKSTSKF